MTTENEDEPGTDLGGGGGGNGHEPPPDPPAHPERWIDEPTPYRRLWGAYLHAGYTRASFARALESQYHAVYQWDCGKVTPTLPKLARAVEILNVSIDDIWFGRNRPARATSQTGELELDDAAIRSELARVNASPEARRALVEHRDGAGRFDAFTGSYVRMFADTYDQRRRAGATHQVALAEAAIAALQAGHVGDAIVRGVRAPSDISTSGNGGGSSGNTPATGSPAYSPPSASTSAPSKPSPSPRPRSRSRPRKRSRY